MLLYGSPNWIRTSDQTINSRLLYRWATGEYKITYLLHMVHTVYRIHFAVLQLYYIYVYMFSKNILFQERKKPSDFIRIWM